MIEFCYLNKDKDIFSYLEDIFFKDFNKIYDEI